MPGTGIKEGELDAGFAAALEKRVVKSTLRTLA